MESTEPVRVLSLLTGPQWNGGNYGATLDFPFRFRSSSAIGAERWTGFSDALASEGVRLQLDLAFRLMGGCNYDRKKDTPARSHFAGSKPGLFMRVIESGW